MEKTKERTDKTKTEKKKLKKKRKEKKSKKNVVPTATASIITETGKKIS